MIAWRGSRIANYRLSRGLPRLEGRLKIQVGFAFITTAQNSTSCTIPTMTKAWPNTPKSRTDPHGFGLLAAPKLVKTTKTPNLHQPSRGTRIFQRRSAVVITADAIVARQPIPSRSWGVGIWKDGSGSHI